MSTYDFLMKEARNEGIEEGLTIKEQQKNKDFATSLIISTDFNDAKIATLVGVSAQYVMDLREAFKK